MSKPAQVRIFDTTLRDGEQAPGFSMSEAGKLSVEGKEYVVEDGDIMHFRFNV